MLTVEALKALGANTDEGLKRCINNESFYLRMVDMGLKDKRFETLKSELESGDLNAAFESAHALKGVLSNLALTSLSDPVVEITELLRAKTETDYASRLEEILAMRDKYLALVE